MRNSVAYKVFCHFFTVNMIIKKCLLITDLLIMVKMTNFGQYLSCPINIIVYVCVLQYSVIEGSKYMCSWT